MATFAQLTLPGFPLRLVVAAHWAAPDTLATVRATLDTPSDQYTQQIEGTDLEGRFTPEELADAMCTLVYELVARMCSDPA